MLLEIASIAVSLAVFVGFEQSVRHGRITKYLEP